MILAGCGGSGAAKQQALWQTVRGADFTFQAPAGWAVEHAKSRVSATRGAELVQISSFPLIKRYDEKLFDRVGVELRFRMQEIARQTGGELGARRTVTVDGARSHAFDVTAGSRVDEYTFVLRGKREHLLLCRRKSPDGAGFCSRLLTSFAVG